MPWYVIYLLAINLLAWSLTVWDKRCARRNRRRVSERALMLVAALGGSPAMLLTMRRIRHKTRHRKFMWGLPIMMLLQAAIVVLCLSKGVF